MIELSPSPQGTHLVQQGFAGDTYNAAYYLRQLLPPEEVSIDYITALGDDLLSDSMIDTWRSQKIGVETVLRLEGRLPGVYRIVNDANGERRFYYWRDQSAATQLFADPRIHDQIDWHNYDYVYLSGITLAITPAEYRNQLFVVLQKVHDANIPIVFDPNYRPRLWSHVEEAKQVLERMLNYVRILLVSYEDYQLLYGDTDVDAMIQRLQSQAQLQESVLTNGAEECFVVNVQEAISVPPVRAEKVIDTTSAGDSFNAGYLAARLKGYSLAEAATCGHRLAVQVIGYQGAILPRLQMVWSEGNL